MKNAFVLFGMLAILSVGGCSSVCRKNAAVHNVLSKQSQLVQSIQKERKIIAINLKDPKVIKAEHHLSQALDHILKSNHAIKEALK